MLILVTFLMLMISVISSQCQYAYTKIPMNKRFPKVYCNSIIVVVTLMLCCMPLFNVHIHLAAQQHADGSHSHEAETHLFHGASQGHDTLDNLSDYHPSDTTAVDLDTDTHLHKPLKTFNPGMVILLILFVWMSISIIVLPLSFHSPPIFSFFDRFALFMRGPPAI